MVRVHHILTPDNTPFLHTHPFSYVSVILDGGYTEQVLVDGKLVEKQYHKHDIATHLSTTPHRITSVLSNTRTLFFTWKIADGNAQGWTLTRHPDIPVPDTYVDYADGMYRQDTGFRKRENGVWFALRASLTDAILCDRISLHQHILPEHIHALDSSEQSLQRTSLPNVGGYLGPNEDPVFYSQGHPVYR